MARLDISLTPEEVDALLSEHKAVRVATVGRGGVPHVVPLWFVWLGRSLFMNSTRGNATVENLASNPNAAAVVDDGETYDDLRGVVLRGPIVEAGDDPRRPDVEHQWSAKYLAGNPVPFATWKNRVWLRLDPTSVNSWDFRKIPDARARKRAAQRTD
jgi:nitroimidazol reductase NimA-like FMN-containing flavoprotein (pyridoxamine 5'-phosphate oxidase superfamily)